MATGVRPLHCTVVLFANCIEFGLQNDGTEPGFFLFTPEKVL